MCVSSAYQATLGKHLGSGAVVASDGTLFRRQRGHKRLGLCIVTLATFAFTACSSDTGEDADAPFQDQPSTTGIQDLGPTTESIDAVRNTTTTTTEESTSIPAPLTFDRVFLANDGQDNRSGGSAEEAIATVERALQVVNRGGTIVFQAGRYAPLELVGLAGTEGAPIRLEADGEVEFTSGEYRSDAGILIRDSENLEIVGMRVRTALWGVFIDNSRNVTVRATDIGDIGQEGIRVKGGSSNIRLDSNIVADTGRRTDQGLANGEGIYIGTGSPGGVDDVRNVVVINNRIQRTTDEAIDVKRPASDIYIIGNTITDIITNTSGAVVVHLNGDQDGDPNVIIEQNVIRNVTRSSPHRDGNCIVSQVTVRIVNNVLDGCQHRGIYLRGNAGTATVLHNTLVDAGDIGALVSDGRGMDIVMQNNLGLAGDANRVVQNDVFVDSAAGDYRLTDSSLAELTTAPNLGVATDLTGAPRPTAGAVTFGAIES